jgi:hypothetical protein
MATESIDERSPAEGEGRNRSGTGNIKLSVCLGERIFEKY